MKRKLPLVLIAISILIFVLIIAFIDSIGISVFDLWFYNEIAEKMNPGFTLFMRFVTESGSTMAVMILCLSLFLFPKARKKWALPVSTSVAVAATLNSLLKLIFARERPNILRLIDEFDYSFPSGHAMTNMAFYAIVLLLTWQYIKNKQLKYGISFICITMPLLIGFSRIYLGVHHATDVIAGWLLGFVIAAIVFIIFNKKKETNS